MPHKNDIVHDTTTTASSVPTHTHSGGGGSWYPTDTSVSMPSSVNPRSSGGGSGTVRESTGRVLTPRDHMTFDAVGNPIGTYRVITWDESKGKPSEAFASTHGYLTTINPYDAARAAGMDPNRITEFKYGDTTVYALPWKDTFKSDVPIIAHGTADAYNAYHPMVDPATGIQKMSPTVEGNPLNMRIATAEGTREITFRGSSTSLLTNTSSGNYQALVRNEITLENVIVPKDRTYEAGKWIRRKYAQFTNGDTMEADPNAAFQLPDNEFGANVIYASPMQTLSPIHPFTRVHPEVAHRALMTSYNRNKLPIADIEHRKAFRHIFITRPECYICCAKGSSPSDTSDLSEQAFVDEEFHSSYMRFPHVARILSPVYVCQSVGPDPFANWNYLLSNRVQGLTTAGTTLGIRESVTAATRGVQITPGTIITSNNGNTIDLQFRDTKYMDIYEMLRMWMLYIHKRTIGEFFPPFNGYQYRNSWSHATNGNGTINGYTCSHPYDRAMEYAASLYDIVVDETGKNILYWCKYYGIFPVSLSNPMLSNDKNSALTGEPLLAAGFRYQYKLEKVYRTLCEFNYNAGLNPELPTAADQDLTAYINKSCYAGAGGMFTGTPFIITQQSMKRNPLDPSTFIKYVPQLCFHMPNIGSADYMNDGLEFDRSNPNPSSSSALTIFGDVVRQIGKSTTKFLLGETIADKLF